MSSCILYVGEVEFYTNFQNSWGGAALIWDYFTEKYFPLKPDQQRWERKVGMNFDMQPIWDLWKRKDLPRSERIVLMSTFDLVMVRRKNLLALAQAFEEFDRLMIDVVPNLTARVNHIAAEAKVFRTLVHKRIRAICWQQTTVADNAWWDDKTGKPYNIHTGTKHWFLLDELMT